MTDNHDSHDVEQAIALEYSDSESLPRVVASGSGDIAKLIVALAEKNNIPVREDRELTSMLTELEQGSEIQQESFRLVAEVLAFLYHVDTAWKDKKPFLIEILE